MRADCKALRKTARSLSNAMDEASFRKFYAETAGPLRQYVARSMGSTKHSDDIAQDAYLRLLRHPPPLSAVEDAQRLRAYLFKIASNLVIDHWRSRKHETDFAVLSDSYVADIPSPEPVDAEAALSREMAETFQKLRLLDRQVMWLAYVEGANHREIATTLGLRERSIRVLLSRARAKLLKLVNVGGKAEKERPKPVRNDKRAPSASPLIDERMIEEQNV